MSQNEAFMRGGLRPAAFCRKIKVSWLHECFREKNKHRKLKKEILKNKKMFRTLNHHIHTVSVLCFDCLVIVTRSDVCGILGNVVR